MYRKAEVLNDPVVDAEACQLALASPDYADADLELMLRRWSMKQIALEPHIVHLVRGRFANFRRKRRTTIGYHCIFWNSPGAEAFALSFIKHHRRDFRIIGYSPFEESSRVQQHFDVFHGATEKYDSETFARLVRSDEVDIFVELSGLSHYHRFAAMALRCAPIQVSYINHLATTQVPNVDYVVGDDIAFPKASDRYFSETIYRLPRCLLTYNYDSIDMPPVSPPPMLENGYTTFGSFGGPYKLNRECIELWAAVLRAVPNSRFLMQNEGMSKQDNIDFIKRQFWKHGVEPERLIILPGVDREANLLNYASMDISLDSWPYCGGNSIAEALWQGVPVVTLKGRRATAAYGASLLSAAGLADLVAETPEEYVDIAARLAASAPRLVDLRRNLRAMMHQHGLADSERMARVLESAFEEMMQRKFGPRPEDKALRRADREVSAVNSEAIEQRRPGLAAAN
jgi:predicted O-linked N-acetylglucosamine transferase (SPINDLY family)